MSATYQNYLYYKRARQAFSFKVYAMLFMWLALALIQWAMVVFIEGAKDTFVEKFYISLLAFVVASFIFGLFIFVERLRFISLVNIAICLVIVELQIVAVFAFAARSFWLELMKR
ncbi:uncharacterized protein LOC111597320 [Drosophila hydei]|uniref:Uncharacterized protein LOC111597320 n=1 Tax=Drosophila hydei TaxID=7224 RepID=A0A6J1LUZ7_DROHY|nr:uncharacterized protein LOC111597320 [Drosophila hydei]